MGSAQSSLDQAYDEKASQLKHAMAQKKKELEVIEGWVRVHHSMKDENAGLKKKCAEQEEKIQKLEEQNALQIAALLAKKEVEIAAETIQKLTEQVEKVSYNSIDEEASGED